MSSILTIFSESFFFRKNAVSSDFSLSIIAMKQSTRRYIQYNTRQVNRATLFIDQSTRQHCCRIAKSKNGVELCIQMCLFRRDFDFIGDSLHNGETLNQDTRNPIFTSVTI